jgi:cell division protein FtsQ
VTVSTSLPDRVAERGRARRRSRLRTVLVVAGALAVVAVAGWLALGSSVLGVKELRVSGVDRLTPAAVERAAAVRPGTPLARLDTAAVARRVAELAPVRSVDVDRRWPGALHITVRERTAAAVQLRGTVWALVDRDGVAFATEARRPKGLPEVSAPIGARPAALRAALDVLAALPESVAAKAREVRAGTPEQVTLRLTRDRTVTWGSTERSARKAAVLEVLLTRKASVYDVSSPDTPTTRR